MPTSSELWDELLEVVQPDENIMFEYEGRGSSRARMDFVPSGGQINTVEPYQKQVRKGDALFVAPDSDEAFEVTGTGEVRGNIDIEREVGQRSDLFRATNGLTVNVEDEQIPEYDLQARRDAAIETFDFLANKAFFKGVQDRGGNTVRKDVFQWIEDNIPADQVIDCSSFTGDPVNVIFQEAYSKTSGEYVDDTWELAAAPHNVWADWNAVDDNSGAGNESYWGTVQDETDAAGVSINRGVTVPDSLTLRSAPSSSSGTLDESITYPSAANGSSDDVMYLIPDHQGDFWEFYEMPSPMTRPVDTEGMKRRVEYMWKYGHVFDNSQRQDNTPEDLIKLESVSSLSF